MNRRKFSKLLCLSAALTVGAGSRAASAASIPNDIFTVLRGRHSVRSYTGQDISEEDEQKILRYAMMAPSALNEQPWEFIVIRDKKILEQIGSANRNASFAADAPLAILLCLNERKEKIKGMSIIDMGACAENLMLAATGLGIGSVFTGIYPHKDRMEAFSKLCKLPDYIQPIGLIVLGYAQISNHRPADRFNPDAIHLNEW